MMTKKLKEIPASTCWPFELDCVSSYAYWEKCFTKEECEKIINIGNSYKKQKAKILRDSEARDSEVRDSEISWLTPTEDMQWVYRRLTDIIMTLNDRFFKFDIYGATENFQFTKYTAPSGRYGKHVDSMLNNTVRKLSFTLQLSNPEDYEGGDLCLYSSEEVTKMNREQGFVTVFPSYVLHEVTPVTKGTRYSLVSWITGKPFK